MDVEKEETGNVNEGVVKNMYGARLVNGVYVAEPWVNELVFRRPKREVVRILKRLYLGV